MLLDMNTEHVVTVVVDISQFMLEMKRAYELDLEPMARRVVEVADSNPAFAASKADREQVVGALVRAPGNYDFYHKIVSGEELKYIHAMNDVFHELTRAVLADHELHWNVRPFPVSIDGKEEIGLRILLVHREDPLMVQDGKGFKLQIWQEYSTARRLSTESALKTPKEPEGKEDTKPKKKKATRKRKAPSKKRSS